VVSNTQWSARCLRWGLNRYLGYEVTRGSFTTERCNLFVRQLIPKLNLFPGPRSVLVLNKAKVNHSPDLIAMYEEAGVRPECFRVGNSDR
jgi:hypothetical protein